MKWPMTGLEEGKVKVNLQNLSEIKDVLGETGQKDTKPTCRGSPPPTLGSFEHQKEKRQ